MEKVFSIREALWRAVSEEMLEDPRIYVWGEGVTSKIYFDYPDLLKSFPDRVQDMPISEAAIVSAGLGASLVGMKPIVDLSFDDLAPRAMDEILNQAAKVRYVTGGNSNPSMIIKFDLPPVRCAQTGQRLEALFWRIPGIVLVIPSTPSDAYGLMISALKTEDIVLVIEDRWITAKESVSRQREIKFGSAALRRTGKDVTIVSYGYQVLQAMDAADLASKKGIEAEVLDLRSLSPLDWSSIFDSVKKTGRLITLEGGWQSSGIGAEICASISEHSLSDLHSPPVRLAAKMTHIPTSSALRMKPFPSTQNLIEAIEKIMISVKAIDD